MENSPVQTTVTVPLKMERSEKLKAFAVVSKHNDVPHEVLMDKLLLTICFAYTTAEAIIASEAMLENQGRHSQEYKTPYMIVGRELEQVIGVETKTEMKFAPMSDEEMMERVDRIRSLLKIQKPATEKKAEEENVDPKSKSVDNLIAYVRYVFYNAGTPAQKKVADEVIKKFQEKYAKGS